MEESVQKTCCFTGHRPAAFAFGSDENHPDCVKLKSLIYSNIQRLYESGTRSFITGMAMGADLWCAEAVMKLRRQYFDIRLLAAVPCPSQAEGWRKKHRARYREIIAACDDVYVVSEFYHTGCMQQRNRYMVEKSSTVLAVYNGTGKGGTAYTVAYAHKCGRQVVVIDPETFVVSRMDGQINLF